MLNTAQFSAAKDLSETKALQSLAIESKSFKEFKDEANKITDVFNNQWLRVEQDLCKRNAIQGEVWRNMEKDKDLYPYWEYKTEEDDRVRDEHAALEGLIFKIGDPEGDSVHPENGWNCRCHSEPVDDMYLKEENKEISKGADYLNEKDPETGNSYIDKNFRYNPGIQGPLPNDSSYSEVLESANKVKPEMFKELPKIFKESTTINEAKQSLLDSGIKKVSLKGLNLDGVNIINETYLELENIYNAKPLTELTDAGTWNKDHNSRSEKFSMAYFLRDDAILITPKSTKPVDEDYLKWVKSRSIEPLKKLLSASKAQSEVIELLKDKKYISQVVSPTTKDMFIHEYGHKLMLQLPKDKLNELKEILIRTKKRGWSYLLSDYAYTNSDEYFAESFVAYNKPELRKFVNPEIDKFITKNLLK